MPKLCALLGCQFFCCVCVVALICALSCCQVCPAVGVFFLGYFIITFISTFIYCVCVFLFHVYPFSLYHYLLITSIHHHLFNEFAFCALPLLFHYLRLHHLPKHLTSFLILNYPNVIFRLSFAAYHHHRHRHPNYSQQSAPPVVWAA